MTVLVVTNAATTRARRGYAALREALPESAGLAHRITEQPGDLAALVAHDAWHPGDLLVISGGDGSVQHALSLLFSHCPGVRLPRIACLPGGSTNMTALDVNRHRRFGDCVAALRRAVDGDPAITTAARPVVRVRHPGIGERCGLFFGTGTIVQGIDYFKAHVRHRGGAQELGAGIALVRTLWGLARNQPPFSEPLEADLMAPPLWCADAAQPRAVTVRLLFATTLDRLFLGMRPYWGTAQGPLKATLVERRAAHLLTLMPRLLRGRPDARMTPETGYHSAGVASLEMTFDGAYTLDGELFHNGNDTIAVSATEPVRFLSL